MLASNQIGLTLRCPTPPWALTHAIMALISPWGSSGLDAAPRASFPAAQDEQNTSPTLMVVAVTPGPSAGVVLPTDPPPGAAGPGVPAGCDPGCPKDAEPGSTA